jgi:succinoglycan biosynthesis transport protein ExoP
MPSSTPIMGRYVTLRAIQRRDRRHRWAWALGDSAIWFLAIYGADWLRLDFTVANMNPQVASDVANETATSLATQVTALEKPSDAADSPVAINTVREATPPTVPSSPDMKMNLALGLVLGLGSAVLREVLDTKVRTDADVKNVTDTAVIATIGFDADAPNHPLIVQSSPHSHRAEAFRRLRTNLQFLDLGDRPQSIVVTSSMPGEGKSTTAANLAITLADAGSRVVLVDGDLRRPFVAEYLGLEGEVGLTTVLIGRATVQDVVQPWGNGYLHVLPAGQVPPNPSELLGSRSMANLLDQLTTMYDIALIDAPPLLPVTDAAILSRLAGGALLVVGANTIHHHHLDEALGALEAVGARVLGVVLNRVMGKHGDAYSYYDYSSGPAAAATETPRPGATSRGSVTPRGSATPRATSGHTRRPERHSVKTGSVPRIAERESTSSMEAIFDSGAAARTTVWPGEHIGGSRDTES